MKIKGIKLVTGDELVAQVVNEFDNGTLEVRDPLLMIMNMVQPTKENPQPGMVCNFYPWTIISSGDIIIQKAAIVAHFDVPKDVETSYHQNTSNIQIVSGAGAAAQILHG